jgi:NADPH:quinone reductase-like Zn-dependent oxidoreductase
MPMKAAIIERDAQSTGPGSLVVRDVPTPSIGDYDVLCDLLYGATCTGTDQHLIAGRFPWPVSYPTVLGHESVGRVIEVGARVRHFRIGDLVSRVGMPAPPAESQPDDGPPLSVNWGGFAEYGVARDHWAMRADEFPASAWSPYRINQIIPPDIDARAATMIITWRETLSYLNRIGVREGSAVLIVGSGGNGLAFASHAAAAGAARVVVLGSQSRRAAAHAAGAHAHIDYRASDAEDQLKNVCPSGFDTIVDAVGQADSANNALPYLKPGGTLAIYGIDDFGTCMIQPQRARGSFTLYSGGYDEAETHHAVIERIRDGRLDASIWLDLDTTFPLTDIHRAFEAVQERRFIKALVKL